VTIFHWILLENVDGFRFPNQAWGEALHSKFQMNYCKQNLISNTLIITLVFLKLLWKSLFLVIQQSSTEHCLKIGDEFCLAIQKKGKHFILGHANITTLLVAGVSWKFLWKSISICFDDIALNSAWKCWLNQIFHIKIDGRQSMVGLT